MNRFCAKFLTFVAAVCVSAGVLCARDTKAPVMLPPSPNPVDVGLGGLQTSLTTGGYRFIVADTPATAAAAVGGPVVVPNTFPATASLQNRSPFEIDFTFPNAVAAELKFTFRIFDSTGALVWQSDTDVTPTPADTTVALGKFQRWKRTAAIPLKPGGKALPAGIYTLEASTGADKQIGASAVFEVVAGPTPPDPTKTGIDGLVLKADSVPVDGQPAPTESPAVGALVVVSEILNTTVTPVHPPVIWSGKTDDQGQFTAHVPAGRYRVTANYVSPAATGAVASLVYPPKTVEVEVIEQQFASVTIHLVPVAPPPPPVQGIKGRVFVPNPVANQPGEPAEIPAVGAQVTIDQITDNTSITPFHWQGVSGPDGVFIVPTPVGAFQVTGSVNSLPPAPAAAAPAFSATVKVVVTAGQFSEIALQIGAPATAKKR